MKKITWKEFTEFIEKDPSWCKNLKEEVEVTTFVKLSHSKITHLSPLLTFSGKDTIGIAAEFCNCPNLKVATGTFLGFVNFSSSGIKKLKT